MENKKNNLEFWNKVEKTNPKYTKKAKVGGNAITSIAPQFQIMNATEQFGVYGETWGFKHIEFDYSITNTPITLKVTDWNTKAVENINSILGLVGFKATFFFPKGEFEITNSIKIFTDNKHSKIDDNFAKKLETDALTKALSKLGFNADIFLGKFDDVRYLEDVKKEFSQIETKKLLPKITGANFKKALKGTEQQVKNVLTQWSLTKEQAEELTDVLSALQSEEPTEQKEEAKPEEKTTTKKAKALKEGSKDWEKVVEYINAGQLTELSQLDDKFTIAKKLQTKIQDLIDNPQKPKAEVKETTQRMPAIPVKLYKEALEMEALDIIPILEKYRMSQTQRDVLTELTKQ